MCYNKDGFPARVAQKCLLCWEIKEHVQSFLLTGMCHFTAGCLHKYPAISQAPCLQLCGAQGRKERGLAAQSSWLMTYLLLGALISVKTTETTRLEHRFCSVCRCRTFGKISEKKKKRGGGGKEDLEIKGIYLPKKFGILKLPFS